MGVDRGAGHGAATRRCRAVGARSAVVGRRDAFQFVQSVGDLRQRLRRRFRSRAGRAARHRRPQIVEVLAQGPDQVRVDAARLQRPGKFVDRRAGLGSRRLDRFAVIA